MKPVSTWYKLYLTNKNSELLARAALLNAKSLGLDKIDSSDEQKSNKSPGEVMQDSALNRPTLISDLVGDAQVPRNAELILSVLYKPDLLEPTLGCMEGIFHKMAARQGVRRAKIWYWAQTVRAIAASILKILNYIPSWQILP